MIWQYLEIPIADAVALLAIKAQGSKTVFVAHELKPWSSGRLATAIRRRVVTSSDLVLVHRDADANDLQALYGIDRSRIVVAEHGDYRDFVDPMLTQSAARTRVGLTVDEPVALMFGALRPSKGLQVLLEAWPNVRQRVPMARLLIVGRPLRGTTLPTAVHQGLDLRPGTVSPEVANNYYVAADVVVLPYDEVTTSGVLRYAFTVARPVVSTAVGEMPAHVRDGQTGWLVPAADPLALADALVDALANRDQAVELGRQAQAYAREAFDWNAAGATTHAAIVATGHPSA